MGWSEAEPGMQDAVWERRKMKRSRYGLYILLIFTLLIMGCSAMPQSGGSLDGAGTDKMLDGQPVLANDAAAMGTLPDELLDSYYAGQEDPAFSYFHNSSVQRFFTMWVKEKTGDLDNPVWHYDGFAQVQVLDHNLKASKSDENLYYLPFSDGNGRFGYLIVKYHEEGPAVSNWSVVETTPYLYDLSTNMDAICESLQKTDIDLPTAKAARVYLFDRENKRADQVIRFTDGKGDDYICYFGEPSFAVEKWKVR